MKKEGNNFATKKDLKDLTTKVIYLMINVRLLSNQIKKINGKNKNRKEL